MFVPRVQCLFAVGAAAALSELQAASPPGPVQLHPALEMRLYASEPDVVDPVALCFDARGRAYVVEMRDYPYGLSPDNRPGGTVRLLEDRDGDGRADRSTLFADGLSFPTSIAPYRDGVIVLAPPEVLLLRDTNGDGRADVREVLYRGLPRGVTDSNASGLRWGLDNWLHAVNGGNGGELVSTRGQAAPLRLGDLDFRLRPDTGAMETTYSTGGGFGLVFDEWGRSFTPHNINHMQMRILPARVLARHPGLPPTEGTASISDHGEMARIYPVSEASTRPNHPEQAGHFSAAGGMGYIGHTAYPEGVAGSVLVCDVAGNLVHRDVLMEEGPVFSARRAPEEMNREFLAATDPAFRPVGLELGPDGAFYLLDMQRDVIEHPDYIPARMREAMDIRAGQDRGRIYRIAPKTGLPVPGKLPGAMTARELVEELANPSQWRRMTAQRLLLEREDRTVIGEVRVMARRHANPLARLHALWVLSGWGALDEEIVRGALEDPHPGVVENALILAEPLLAGSDRLRRTAEAFVTGHPVARVRWTAVLGLGGAASPTGVEWVSAYLRRDGGNRWARLAALSALPAGELAVLGRLLDAGIDRALAVAVVRDLADLAGARLAAVPEAAFRAVVDALGRSGADDGLRTTFLDGLRAGLARRGGMPSGAVEYGRLLEPLAARPSLAVRTAVWAVGRQLGLAPSASQAAAIEEAGRVARDATRPVSERVEAIHLMRLAPAAQAVPLLLASLDGATLEPVQRAAIEQLGGFLDPAIAGGLIARWRFIHPALRRPVTQLLLRRREYHEALVTAIEQERIRVGELNLDLEDRRRLLRWSSPAIQARAAKFLADGEYGNRQAKVDEWLSKLPSEGEPARGRPVFERACASCHVAGGVGQAVGPDLTAVGHRSVEDLVSNILDPNMAIHPNYLAVSVETSDGELLTGLIASETPEAVTLLQAQGLRTTLRRDRIVRQEATGASLMPEGLEVGMTPQDLCDLVAFLQRGR